MHFYRARQHPEAFLEVVTVRRRPATRRNEHVEHREAAVGLLTREQHGVGVADHREVDERLVVGTRDRELARRIISRQGRRGSDCRIVHLFLPAVDDGVGEDRDAGEGFDERAHQWAPMRHLRRQRNPIIGWVFHASARTRPAATSSAAVSPWTPNALESFPPFVRTIRASAVGVIAAATSTQPSVARPADAQATSGTTPEVMSRAPLISVRPRRLSAATPKSRVAWRGWRMKRMPRTMIATHAMSPTSRAARCMRVRLSGSCAALGRIT